MYSLLNGTFSIDGMELGINRFKAQLHGFFSDYFQRTSTGYANLMQHFAALTYLPMDRKNFFGVQSFMNMLTLRFREVKHVLLQYAGLIIWSDIDLSEAVTASHYITKFLHPDVSENEMQAIHSSSHPHQTAGVRLGRYYDGPADHFAATKNSSSASSRAYLRTGGDPNSVHMTRYRLLIYGTAGALITLFLEDSEAHETDYLTRLETFLEPSLGSLALSLADQYTRFRNPQWSQDSSHVKYLYINEATLAQKQTLVDKTQVVQVDFLKALIGIYEDVKSHNDFVEIYEKVFRDCWIYGKRTFDRSLYAIVTQRNIDLVLAEEELRKVYLKEFPDSHEAMT
ncbi:hypothetical protein RvY_09272 [Ramazzottius varieornatus]|uniref:CCZ1/INTU/HPS4 third Longin domain-containing protein n=1 Tax=Ramazzottius varieornatus TaxID=947166 RepID=A0A1D1V8T3_RAMVA|nr:hypothetical protein RvY_09272 [Ramazzottius varieornatus]